MFRNPVNRRTAGAVTAVTGPAPPRPCAVGTGHQQQRTAASY